MGRPGQCTPRGEVFAFAYEKDDGTREQLEASDWREQMRAQLRRQGTADGAGRTASRATFLCENAFFATKRRT